MTSLHLAFIHPSVLAPMLDGSKTCEARLGTRRPLAWGVSVGDTLLFKAGDGVALARVWKIDRFESERPLDVYGLRAQYRGVIDPNDEYDWFWESKANARYAVLMHLSVVIPLHIPGNLLPTTRAAWINDFTPDVAEAQEILLHGLRLLRPFLG